MQRVGHLHNTISVQLHLCPRREAIVRARRVCCIAAARMRLARCIPVSRHTADVRLARGRCAVLREIRVGVAFGWRGRRRPRSVSANTSLPRVMGRH